MIPTQAFGSTGHESTRTIFGAAALWGASEEEGERAQRDGASGRALVDLPGGV